MTTWLSAAECSTVGQQRPEKLDRRWLKDGCVGQQAMMSMQSRDADEPHQYMTDGVPLQGTAELSGVGMCIYQNSQLKLDALHTFRRCNCVRSGVMRSYLDAENTSRTAEFTQTASVWWDGIVCHCQPVLRYHRLVQPLQNERRHQWLTVEQSAELSDEHSAVDAESQKRQQLSLRRATSLTHHAASM